MENKVYNIGEVVFREGDDGTCFYRIKSGKAGVYLHYGEADQRKLTDMVPGQFFGEMAIIETRPRSTTIVAEEELHVVEVPERELNEYFAEEPDTILALMKQISGRIRALTEEYDEVKAFLKEKQDAEAPKKEGFLNRLKKYIEISKQAKKYEARTSSSDAGQEAHFERKGDTPLPIASYKRGDILFREGDAGDCMFAIHNGSVDIYTNYGNPLANKLTTLHPKAFFGEMGMIDQEPRSATAVVAESDTVLEVIRPDDLKKLIEANPVEVDQIMRHLSKRLRRLTEDYAAACEEAAKTE